MNLFDFSSIIVLCGERKLDKLLEGWTINPAYYGAWKRRLEAV